MAQAIRLNTMACPETISMTMMRAVKGPCVVAARKPTMPSAIKGMAACWLKSANRATSRPMPAPMPAPLASDGANTPPGTPDQADSQVAQNFSTV